MNHSRIAVRARVLTLAAVAGLACVLLTGVGRPAAAQAPGGQPAAQAPVGPIHLDVTSGTATYRVQEQLAGVNFPTDAVGSTDAVTGTIVMAPDGMVDSSQSKLTVDLKMLKSDQDMRDGYIRGRVFEVDKYPTADFVPTHIEGLPSPLPTNGQSGFQMIGNMTIHGVTKEITWNGVVTFNKDGAAGRAMTDLTFAEFGLMKPTLARLLSVGDKIGLEVIFRTKRA